MALDPTGQYLIAGGADGGGAKIYERAPDSHWLNEIAHTELEAPTAFLWV
jgi:hypothetical protein